MKDVTKEYIEITKKSIKEIMPIILILLLFDFSNIPLSIFNINIESLSTNTKIIYNFIMDILFLLILFLIYRKDLTKDFKLFKKDLINNIEYAFKLWLIGVCIMAVSNILITVFSPSSVAGNEEEIRNLIKLYPIYMIFNVSIYAPLTEEIIFRKSIRDTIKNKYAYILISGLLFGSLHVVTILSSYLDLLYLIPYCALGITFAYTYYKSKNIFSTISMHSLHNTLAIMIYLIGNSL